MDGWADGWARTDGRTDRGAGQRDCSRPSRTQAPPSERRPGEGGAGAAVWTDELTCAQPVVAGNCSARMRWGDVDARCGGGGDVRHRRRGDGRSGGARVPIERATAHAWVVHCGAWSLPCHARDGAPRSEGTMVRWLSTRARSTVSTARSRTATRRRVTRRCRRRRSSRRR